MRDFITRHVPLWGFLQDASGADIRQDAIAGLTTAVMLVPQAMAYAMLAGLDPIVGLYAATIPTAIYAFLGTSRVLAVGPVAMDSLLVAAAVAPLAGRDPVLYATYASILMLMVGVIQLIMGTARLGFLVKYLSKPVIAGFTSAAALIIGFSQLKHILGINIERSQQIHTILLQAIQNIQSVHMLTLGIAMMSVVTLIVLKKKAPQFPRFLLVVVAGTVLVWGLNLSTQGVAIVGSVPGGFPSPKGLPLNLDILQKLLPSAITIALIAFMESIAVAKAFAKQTQSNVDANKELRAIGIANLGGAFFQGYPITGGFSRTAVNAQAGARTPLAGLFTALIVVLSLLFLTPMFHDIPKAILAAIIMTAIFGLIDIKEAKNLWHLSKPDFALMFITFAATLTLGIGQGIGLGVLTSLLWFVMANAKPHVALLGRVPGTHLYRNVERYPDAMTSDTMLALRIDAPLFFANTAFLQETIEAHIQETTQHLVLDAGAISHIDASGVAALVDLAAYLETKQITFWLCTVRGPIRDALAHSTFHDHVPKSQVVERVCLAAPCQEQDGDVDREINEDHQPKQRAPKQDRRSGWHGPLDLNPEAL